MSDFLAQHSHTPNFPRKAQTPSRIHESFDLPNQSRVAYIPNDHILKNPSFLSPTYIKMPKNVVGSPYVVNKGSLPAIDELPPIRTPKRVGIPHKPRLPASKSTPNMSMRPSASPEKNGSKPPVLYNQKHNDAEPLEEDRSKMIDYTQIKAFSEKYKVEFVMGYHKNILNRCVDLMNTENDPFILENIVPNKYKDYLNEAEKSRQNNLPSISEFGSQMLKKYEHEASFHSVLPEIRNKGINGKEIPSLKKGKFFNNIDRSVCVSTSTQEKQMSTMSSSLSLNMKISLPKLDIETFELALDYYKNNEQDGIFVFIKAPNKGTVCEFGFCEVVFDEKKRNVAYMTKYFIPRVYRKLKMVLPITVRLLEHLFKTQKLEKLAIKMLAGNTFVQNDLRILGFKLEKIEFEEGRKMKIYTIRKAEVFAILEKLADTV